MRGLIQLTGRANYTTASKALGVDFVSNPERAAEPQYAALTAAWFWSNANLNPLADQNTFNSFKNITLKVNGSCSGAVCKRAHFEERLKIWNKAKEIFNDNSCQQVQLPSGGDNLGTATNNQFSNSILVNAILSGKNESPPLWDQLTRITYAGSLLKIAQPIVGGLFGTGMPAPGSNPLGGSQVNIQGQDFQVPEHMKGSFILPCQYTAVTSRYRTPRRPNHYGIDLSDAPGTPIWASKEGTVVTSGGWGGGGQTIRIDHPDGTLTEYMHMQKLYIPVGQAVRQGQQRGELGNTGRSTGPHLHFGVKVNGNFVNPESVLTFPPRNK